MPKPDIELVDRIGSKMREAYAKHTGENLKTMLPYQIAQSKEAWRACARAAIAEMSEHA